MKFFDNFKNDFKSFFSSQVDYVAQLLAFENPQAFAEAKKNKHTYRQFIRQKRLSASLLLSKLNKLGYTKLDIDKILKLTDSAETLYQILDNSSKAKTLGLKYFKPKYVIKALEKGWQIPVLFEITEKFEQHNLEEQPGFADYAKLFTYPNFSDLNALELVNILIQFKYHEINITQPQLIRYFYAHRPESEDLKNLYHGVLISKEKRLDLTISDFIKGILDKRMPRALAITYARIRENALAISKDRYMTMGIEQSIIDKVVKFMILAKKHDIIIDFEDIIKQYSSGQNVFDVLRILIKLHESGFKQIDFGYLTRLALMKVDISKIIAAFNYAKANLDLDQFLKAIDRTLPIRKTTEDEPPFDLVNFARALHIGSTVFGIDPDTIINDYIAGTDVWKIIDLMKYAKDKGVEVNYIVAKILHAMGKLQEVLYNTLNPFEIETDYIQVTTKDNIEIKTKLTILVTYNLNNYFKGTDKDYLIRLIKAVFIEQIQQHYNHDQIIQNIENISNNILRTLLPPEKGGKSEGNLSHFLKVSKYNPVKIIIPRIDFVKDTFKEIDKIKHEYNAEKELKDLEIERLRAEIKIKEAWAQSKDLRYLILKDDDKPLYSHRHHNNPENEDTQE